MRPFLHSFSVSLQTEIKTIECRHLKNWAFPLKYAKPLKKWDTRIPCLYKKK